MIEVQAKDIAKVLTPILGKSRSTVVANVAAREFAATEGWVIVPLEEVIELFGEGLPMEAGIIKTDGRVFRLHYSEFYKRWRAFELYQSERKGVILKGWYTRIMADAYTIISPTEEEKAQTLHALNSVVLEHKLS